MLVTAEYNQDDSIAGIDKSYNEIVDALENGVVPFMIAEVAIGPSMTNVVCPVTMHGYADSLYQVTFRDAITQTSYQFENSDSDAPMESPR